MQKIFDILNVRNNFHMKFMKMRQAAGWLACFVGHNMKKKGLCMKLCIGRAAFELGTMQIFHKKSTLIDKWTCRSTWRRCSFSTIIW